MTAGAIIKILLEAAAVILLIVGFINEEKVIAFEHKLVEMITASIAGFLSK